MTRKVMWSLTSCLMALFLVIAACGPAAPTTPTAPTIPAPTATTAPTTTTPTAPVQEKPQQEAVKPGAKVPKYGGTFTFHRPTDIPGYDPAITRTQNTHASYQVNDELLSEAWDKGPGGTGETDWTFGSISRIDLARPGVAEEWSLPDDGTILVKIRKGVRWALDPQSEASRLVNGREFTAADAVWSLERAYSRPTTYFALTYPVGERPTSYKALDKYTLEIKVPPAAQGRMIFMTLAFTFLLPREVAEKYGDFQNWRNLVGTGPFTLREVVPGSSITYVKNPNYYDHDPLYPQNQLPYVDTVRNLIIPDVSTQLAAFRTGKLDQITEVSWEDAAFLMKNNPSLINLIEIATPTMPWGRTDKLDLPFKDIRVRQALNLAVNKQELIDKYYKGNAVMLGVPWPPTPTYSTIYTPMDQQPAAVQELFTYNPVKAKKLLAEAGYPNGFKTQIVLDIKNIDFVAMIADYFLKIGVDMTLKPLDAAIYTTVNNERSFPEMIFRTITSYGNPSNLNFVRGVFNPSYLEPEWGTTTYDKIQAIVGKDDAQVARLLKPTGPLLLESAIGVWLPAPYTYNLGWPWLLNYHGERLVGYGSQRFLPKYISVDAEMKKSMGY